MKILGQKHFRQREEQAPMLKGRKRLVFETQKMKAGNIQNTHREADGG